MKNPSRTDLCLLFPLFPRSKMHRPPWGCTRWWKSSGKQRSNQVGKTNSWTRGVRGNLSFPKGRVAEDCKSRTVMQDDGWIPDQSRADWNDRRFEIIFLRRRRSHVLLFVCFVFFTCTWCWPPCSHESGIFLNFWKSYHNNMPVSDFLGPGLSGRSSQVDFWRCKTFWQNILVLQRLLVSQRLPNLLVLQHQEVFCNWLGLTHAGFNSK